MHLSQLCCKRRALCQVLLSLCLAAMPMQLVLAASTAQPAIALVAEMQRPPGIRAGKTPQIRQMAGDPRGEPGVVLLREFVAKQWQQVRAIDLVSLSRFHIDATRGWQVPVVPGDLPGRIIAAETDRSAFYVEVVGPRLPASFDIVHRHLTFYARYQPASGKLDRITATIRLQVFE